MTRSLLRAAFALLAAPAAFAQSPPPPPGSLNTWVEACEAEEAAPDLAALLEHEALIMPIEGIVQNFDGTFSIVNEPLEKVWGAFDLCETSRFFGETRVTDKPFRSAVQVGSDLVLTAWHGPFAPKYLESYVVVTGLRSWMSGETCRPASFEHIPADRLFALVGVVADGYAPPGPSVDFLLLRLDRPMDATWPRVRRSGGGHPGDSITGIGHPERMSAKVDVAGTAGRVRPFPFTSWEALDVANLHLLDGSSGGMVYNRTQRILETVARQGGNAFLPAVGWNGCREVRHVDGWSQLNASLVHFAANIPAFELVVNDLDPVVNAASLGGALPFPATSRTVGAPFTAAGPIAYEIVPPPPFTPGQPTLLITPGAPLTGTLAPGTAFTIQEQAHIHGVAACGRYEKSYVVRDLTHGFEDVARHQFEIGLRDFSVTPEPARYYADIALPLEQTIAYTLHNPGIDSITLDVSIDVPWALMHVPGGSGPAASLQVTLDGGASEEVVVEIVGPLPPETLPHEYKVKLAFALAPGTPCPASTAPMIREFTLAYGREQFHGPGAVVIPDAPAGAIFLDLPIDEPFCVGDVDVNIATFGVPATHVVAKLKGAPALPITLWDQGRIAGTQPLQGVFDDQEGGSEGTLHPVEPLSTFNGTLGNVTWRLEIQDLEPGLQGSLAFWGLTFTAAPCED